MTMPQKEITCEIKTYIQPFERLLALEELRSIARAEPIPQENGEADEATFYRVVTEVDLEHLLKALTFWETLCYSDSLEKPLYTRQVRYEAASEVARNGVIPEELPYVLPLADQISPNRRRNLRYGTHGIHEYRGKFFPQLVRSLLNISIEGTNAVVVDPMCGSGTTLVEAGVLGYTSYGLDMNPLSVLMSQAKTEVLKQSPNVILNEFKQLEADLLSTASDSASLEELQWFSTLSTKDKDYLVRWFAGDVLTQLDPIVTRVNKVQSEPIRKLFLIALSNILREVSWQKVDDLRVRKQNDQEIHTDVRSLFLDELKGSVKSVIAFLLENEQPISGNTFAIEKDAREASKVLHNVAGAVDVIITSPPYATALPYLDTDRLSLSYLNLLPRPKHRRRDYFMIGNREITEKYRRDYLEKYRRHKSLLPSEITEVIDLIHDLNENADVGFRRKNLSALLAKYFFDMREVLSQFVDLLKPGGYAYVVIGNNHTIAGGQRVDIPTDVLLGQLGESVGLCLERAIPMDMLVSRDIFKKNAGSAETILCFRS
jgi:site-specific DNA-methyltransferase (cytosine-N4-specific)